MESHLPGSLPAAQNVTVDEIIGAYKQACQKLNCRQIPKLLRQLQVCQVTGGGGGPWGEAALQHPLGPWCLPQAREGTQNTPPPQPSRPAKG